MKLDDIKPQVEYYFKNTPLDQIMKDLEESGAVFEKDDFVCDRKEFGEDKCKIECDWCKYWNNYLE